MTSRYFLLTPSQRETTKAKQKQRHMKNPWQHRRRMYLRACEKGLIKCPRKLAEYDGPRHINLGGFINGEEEEG